MGHREAGLSDLKGLQHCCACDMHTLYKNRSVQLFSGETLVYVCMEVLRFPCLETNFSKKGKATCQLVFPCCWAVLPPGTLEWACLKCPLGAAELAWQVHPWGKRFGAGFHLDLQHLNLGVKTVYNVVGGGLMILPQMHLHSLQT